MKGTSPTYKTGKKPEQHASRKTTVQPKLKVNTPGDQYEQEADAMAEKVMRKKKQESETGIIARSVQPITKKEDDKDDKKTLMRKAEAGAGIQVSPGMVAQLGQAQQSGTPLPDATRSFMENAFNRDFSGVRIHTGDKANAMNREINAKAFTHGNDIYFNTGQFSPGSPEGKHLLAHELTHVVQQNETDTTPDVSRSIELRPPGRGEASAFDRVNELIDRLNKQSSALQYHLDGHTLKYDVKDASALTSFDKRMQAFIDRTAIIPMRLITKEGLVDGQPLWVDSFRDAYLDLDDMLACTDLSFQMNLIHLLAERFNVPDYARLIGMPVLGASFQASHQKGFEAEAQYLGDLIGDATISFVYEEAKPSGVDVFGFRSREGYYIFHVFPRDNRGIRAGSLFVLTKDKRRISVDDLIKERKAAAKPVMPKLAGAPLQNKFESQADAMANRILKTPPKNTEAKQSQSATSGTIMRKSSATGGFHPTASFGSKLAAAKGGGSPLPTQPKRFMERTFNADFSQVRIHNDETAAALSDEIDANAFTWGNDIFFNKGLFAPSSITGTGLLAHELTHVLQQGGAGNFTTSHADNIHRAKQKSAETKEVEEEPDPVFISTDGSKIETTTKNILRLKDVPYQEEKFNNVSRKNNFFLQKKERPVNQRDIWRKDISTVPKAVKDKIRAKGKASSKKENNNEYFFFKLKALQGRKSKFVIGTLEEIAETIITPTWNRKGEYENYDVDHIIEWQIGGKHDMSNFWLWQFQANRSGGSTLKNTIDGKIKKMVSQAINAKKVWLVPKKKGKAAYIEQVANKVKDDFEVWVDNIKPGLKVTGKPEEHYSKQEIFKEGAGLEGLAPMEESEIHQLSGNESTLAIMIGNRTSLNLRKVKNNLKTPKQNWLEGFNLLSVEGYNPKAKAGEQYANLVAEFFPRQKERKMVKALILDVPVIKVGGVAFLGKIESSFAQHLVDSMEFPAWSPIQVNEAYFDETDKPVVRGKILSGISFLKGLDIDVIYSGNDVIVEKTFTADDLRGRLPYPFEITQGEIKLFANMTEKTAGVVGELQFEIKKLGTGSIRGLKQVRGFALDGEFNFEKGLFDESHIKVGYKKLPDKESGDFSFEGYAKKSPKDSKIFKSASVKVSYIDGVFSAKGEAETKLKAINKGSIEVIIGKGETSLVADFTVGDGIPGVQSGDLHFLFRQKEDGSYIIDASATVLTKFKSIPSVSLHGFYNSDGTFLFEGDAIINTERFKGKIHFGITNQEVKDGQFTGKMGKELVPFGEGDIDFKLTDWLHGSIHAKVSPDARIELGGELRPDQHLQIVKLLDPIRKKFGEFHIPEFTIFGIPHVADIFVGVKGDLYFNADIGPLFLNDAFLKFDHLYIDAPEQTNVTGGGTLDIPVSAEAGLEATVYAGGRILVVKATISLTGSIGFAIIGNAGMTVAFSWNIEKGITLDKALAYLKAKTELVGRLGGDFDIDLDLLLTTVNLYHKPLFRKEKRWPLGLDLDLNFPLAFNKESGSLIPPAPEEIKDPKPEVDEDKVKKAATEEPPAYEPAPGKKEALEKVRVLPAIATLGSNWITNKYERYNYIRNLKEKYPDISWTYLDDEAKLLDARAFENLKSKLLNKDALPMTDFGIHLRQLVLDEFEEKHLYINEASIEELRNRIDHLQDEKEETNNAPGQSAPTVPDSISNQNNSTT